MVEDFVHGPALGGAVLADGVPDGDERHRLDVRGDAEQILYVLLVQPVEGGERRAQAEAAGG